MSLALTPVPVSTLEADLARFRQMQKQGRHDDVLTQVMPWLSAHAQNRDLLLTLAVSQRYTSRLQEASDTLDRLEAEQPAFSRLHQERGLCAVALKDAPRAIDSLLRAVNLNPALPVSWAMLEGLYRLVGDQENAANAANAADHVATLKKLPAAILAASALFYDGDLGPAENIIRPFLLQHGDHPEAMRLLARIGMARDVLDDAEILLEGVLAIDPQYHAARYDYAQVLSQRQKYILARVEVNRLLALSPASIDYRTLAATIAVGLGDYDQAIGLYKALLDDVAPQASADFYLWMAHALKTVGRTPEAIEAYKSATAARQDFGDAYWSLANLKSYRFETAQIDVMRAAEMASTTTVVDRRHLCFALGKALEDRGETAESWRYYERGNALSRAESRYRAEIFETNTARQKEVCTSAFFSDRQGWGSSASDPIFIVGLPRSGSTLIEQILASHSQVEGTQELPDIPRIALELQGRDPDLDNPRYPKALDDLTPAHIQKYAETYLSDTAIFRSDRAFFVDKMPNNFRHIGLIHLMLPNAKIIDARREPMACCFSNFKQLFAQGQEFTYSIDDIARYYRTYLELMEHWDKTLPGRVLRVRHESMVEDLDGQVRRILDHCGLTYEPACVEFYKTKRSVRTPSSEQVRQPIFRDGLDQWKAYAPWLSPLEHALGDALQRYRT